MDSLKQGFDRLGLLHRADESHSSLQEIESQRWNYALESSQRALRQSMDSLPYRQFLNNSAPVWNQDTSQPRSPPSGNMRGGEGGIGAYSPSSDTTVRLNGYHGHIDTSTRSPLLQVATSSPAVHNAHDARTLRSEITLPPRSYSCASMSTNAPHEPHFGEPSLTPTIAKVYSLPPGWDPLAQDHSTKSQLQSRFVRDCNEILTANLDKVDTRAFLPPAPSPREPSPKDLHVRRPTIVFPQGSNIRMSSLPTIPSPLGPRRMREQHGGGDSGGVSLLSIPDKALPTACTQDIPTLKSNGAQIKNLHQKNYVPSSPTVQRYASTGSIQTPVFDTYPRSAHIDNEGNIYLPPQGSAKGPVHSRKPTDPFIDHETIQQRSAYLNQTRMSGTSTPLQLPSQPPMGLPPTPVSAAWPISAPTNSGFTRQPIPGYTPFVPEPVFRGRPPTRKNLPIPPPPLPFIHNQLEHNPESRAHLDAQKPIREEWIRTPAAKIAQLARLRHAAQRRFRETHSKQDYENWQKAEVAFADATNLEKRQEERRNLFLNGKGMMALKTDKVRDMSAASRSQGGKEREEKLLGFKMALMERECAEVRRGEGEEVFTKEMLATLSVQEKEALRKVLVERLERS